MKLLQRGIARNAPWGAANAADLPRNAHRSTAKPAASSLLARDKRRLIALADQFWAAEKVARTCVASDSWFRPRECVEVEARPGAASGPQPGLVARGMQAGQKAKTLFELRNGFGIHAFELSAADRSYSSDSPHLPALRLSDGRDSLYGGRPLLLAQAQAE